MLSCFSCVQLFVTLWPVAQQAPLPMGFSRQEYWNGLPGSPPGDLPNPGMEPGSPALQAESLPSEPPGKPIPSQFQNVSALRPTERPRSLRRNKRHASCLFWFRWVWTARSGVRVHTAGCSNKVSVIFLDYRRGFSSRNCSAFSVRPRTNKRAAWVGEVLSCSFPVSLLLY